VSFCFCELQLLRLGSNEQPRETSQLDDHIKDANQEYIKQAQEIVDIVEECQTLGITKKPMLPFRTKESLFGRTYHLGVNLQNCKKHIREAALGKCWEYDLNGAVIAVKLTILEQILDSAGGNIDGLVTYSKQYLDEKDEIRERLAGVLHDSRVNRHHRDSLTSQFPIRAYAKEDIKRVFTAISFGADISKSFWFSSKGEGIQYGAFAGIIRNKEDRTNVLDASRGFLRKFVEEQKEMNQIILDNFMADKDFQDLIAKHPDTFGKSRLSKPTVMAYIYQQFESKIIDRIAAGIVAELEADPLVEDKTSPVILVVHDGFYSNKPISKPLLESIIARIQYGICRDNKGFITMSMNKLKPWRYSPFVLTEYEWKIQKAIYEKEAEGYIASRGRQRDS